MVAVRAAALVWLVAALAAAGAGACGPQEPSGPVRAAATTRPAVEALPGTAEGGWREARGDPRNLGVSHGPTPALTGPRWRFIADSPLMNSPAVDGGTVVFASRNGRVYAVRTKDGTKIWEKPVSPAPSEGSPPTGFTFSASLIREGRVTIGSEDGRVYCLSLASGDVLWSRHLGGTSDSRVWSSPKTDGKLVFIGSNGGTFWALDPATGEPRWKADVGDDVGGTAGILGSEVYVLARDKKMHVFDAATGARRWNVELEGWSRSAPALHRGFAFVRATGGKIAAVDLLSRGVKWGVDLSSSMYPNTSLAAEDDRVYATSAGILTAFDALTGDQAWQLRARSAFDASPIVVGDWIIAASTDQNLYAVNKKSGVKVKELLLSEKLIATPAIVDGIVYVAGASGTLFAVE